jgi:adenine-specific DNA-methyltransferase
MARSARNTEKEIDSLRHREARRKHIPTAELETLVSEEEQAPKTIRWKRNTDLDPQLVWRGKDEQDAEDLTVDSVPIYIQEKIKPEAIVSDLRRRSEVLRRERAEREQYVIPDIYSDFNGLSEAGTEFDFYKHDKNWSNRMILGDSLLVMTSLAEKEALKGQIQCIYMDPPYGIGFNSNWQPSTKSRDVKDGQTESLTREPEMIRAFRDTWSDGIHSYLTYLRDRLVVARDLLDDSGSIFVQIGDENVHRVRALMDEVFGHENFVSEVTVKKTGGLGTTLLKSITDYVLWYAKSKPEIKFHKGLLVKKPGEGRTTGERYSLLEDDKLQRFSISSLSEEEYKHGNFRHLQYDNLISSGFTPTCIFDVNVFGSTFSPGGQRSWKTNRTGMERLIKAGRVYSTGRTIRYVRYLEDYSAYEWNNIWEEFSVGTEKLYVIQSAPGIIQSCITMTTDPGDLVLDPTCGSGTTAYVAEQWGRRWITIDTSRVALRSRGNG